MMKTEKVFEIGGEGGGISIIREKDKSEEKFIYHHSEFDPTNEGLDVNKSDEYINFDEPFQLINNKYRWYLLYIETVHEDFRNYIIDKLIDKLNENSISPDYLNNSKNQLEHILKIELKFEVNKKNEQTWRFFNNEEK